MRRLTWLAAALVLASDAPAFAAGVTANPGNLYATVKAAQPGDVIHLQSGTYGNLELWALAKEAPGVVIEPAPGAAPDITSLNADDSKGLTFRGLEIQPARATRYAVQSTRGSNLVFDRLVIHQRDNATLEGVGVFIRDGSNVTVSNSIFHHLGVAIVGHDSTAVTFTGNKIAFIGADGINLAGTGGSLVSNNEMTNLTPSADWVHPDAIQLWATEKNPRPSGNRIIGNTYLRGEAPTLMPAQGVFVEDNDDLVIRDNVLFGPLYNGISLARSNRVQVEGNFLQGWPDYGTRIIVRDHSADVTVKGNASQEVADYKQDGANPRFVSQGNTIVRAARPGDRTVLNAWLAARAPAAASR